MSERSYGEGEQRRQQDAAETKRQRRGSARCANGPTPPATPPRAWWFHRHSFDGATGEAKRTTYGPGEERRLARIEAEKKKHAEKVQATPDRTERAEKNRRKRARRSSRGYLLVPSVHLRKLLASATTPYEGA